MRIQWADEVICSKGNLQHRTQRTLITITTKVRYLCYIYPCKSSTPGGLSPTSEKGTQLVPIQDVRMVELYILMLRRAKRLRSFSQPFYGMTVRRCCWITKNGVKSTNIFYKSLAILDYVNGTLEDKGGYDTSLLSLKLTMPFDHFFEAEALLKRKRVPWESVKALTAGRLKLDEYHFKLTISKDISMQLGQC